MTTEQLKKEHKYRYEEFLGIGEIWGVPSEQEHNAAVEYADSIDRKLRAENGMVAKLRELRESL